MDKLDKRILDLLQKDADLTAADIAERVGLSKAPCWRRIQRLRERGIIKRTVALLDARALNVGTTVFVTIKAPSHSAGAVAGRLDGHEDGRADIERPSIEQRHGTLDDAAFTQALDATPTGGLREADSFGNIGCGEIRILLQQV